MNTAHAHSHPHAHATLLVALPALALLAAHPAWGSGGRSVEQHVAADPAGTVEVSNVAGRIDLQGWDRAEVAVAGTVGDQVEKVDVAGTGMRVAVKVILKKGTSWGGQGEANLVVHVPARSAVDVSLVSADLHVTGIAGAAHLQTVSGDINGDAAGDVNVTTVSGDVHLAARGAHEARFKTVSGDLMVDGPAGSLDVGSVSGDAHLTLGSLTRLHAETVSGDLMVRAALATGGQVEASSVSGDVRLDFDRTPDADFDVSAFSGDVSNCFGPKAKHEEYGPGTHLDFRSGKGGGRVRVNTQSGDISICDHR